MKHGAKGTYLRGCRCHPCRDAWRLWHLAYRQRRNPGTHECLICGAGLPTARGRDLHELYLHDRHERKHTA